MSSANGREDHGALLRDALVELERLRADARARAGAGPIAIVGLGCRFPGGMDGPDAFWQGLLEGRDAVQELASERWAEARYFDPDPATRGKTHSRHAGLVGDLALFDAAFFGIAPREAHSVDPQQRLLLEVAWEALEHAAIPPSSLSGRSAGVFVGLASDDYFRQLLARGPEEIDAYLGQGTSPSVASGRLSYFLDLHGPSVTVNTACSSSLVAVHLACASLRALECDVALAGGVNRIARPEASISLSKSGMLSRRGRCSTFSADADGFVRGEGCGVVVLKRLAQARADGDAVLAVIRGSAVNQDGHTSGLTVPNGLAQEEVVRRALRDAGLAPQDIGYVESHGTGTPLGDPIELRALVGALCHGRPAARPLALGSVKTNIGHLEAAAGIAGLIKATLCVERGWIPPHLHCERPTAAVAWDELPLVVPRAPTPWREPRAAGVSSFGFSGTNAHAIVAQAGDAESARARPARGTRLLTISARSPAAVAELARRTGAYLRAHPELPLADACSTRNRGREHFAYRAFVVADGVGEAAARLDETPEVEKAREHPRVAFLFPGQGEQHVAMGRELFESQPAFRATLASCDAALRAELPDAALLDVLYPAPGAPDRLDRTAWAQPALVAVQIALVETWRALGVRPAAVLGCSIGELAAAYAADSLTLAACMQLAARRARLVEELCAPGAMLAVSCPEDRARELCARAGVELAVVNAPDSCVLSGPPGAIAGLAAELSRAGVACLEVRAAHAFHGPSMARVAPRLAPVLAAIERRAPTLPVVSGTTGRVVGAELASAAHWVGQLEAPLRLQDGLRALEELELDACIELGPQASLCAHGRRAGRRLPRSFPSLRRGGSDSRQLLESAGALYRLGVELDWRALDADGARAVVSLPTYPFERRRFWVESAPARSDAGPGAPERLPGARIRSPLETSQYEARLAPPDAAEPALRIGGSARVGAARTLAAVHEAASALLGTELLRLEGLTLTEALCLDAPRAVQTLLARRDRDGGTLRVLSASGAGDAGPWREHVSGAFVRARGAPPVGGAELDAGRSLPGAAFYAACSERGVEVPPRARVLAELALAPGGARAHLDAARAREVADTRVAVSLEAAFQALAALAQEYGHEHGLARDDAWSPRALEALEVHAGAPAARVDVWRRAAAAEEELVLDALVVAADGSPVCSLVGVRLAARVEDGRAQPGSYELVWRERAAAPAEPSGVATFALLEPLPPSEARADLEEHARALTELERVCAGLVVRTLEQLGLAWSAGRALALEPLAVELGVVPFYRRLLARFLDVIVEEGWAEARGDGWLLHARPDVGDAFARLEALAARHASLRPELGLLARTAPVLPEVLRGRRAPLEVLFPDGDFAALEAFYRGSLAARLANERVGAILARLAERRAGGHLSVLEVGAGSGATSEHAQRALPGGSRYVFTDVSPYFLAKARARGLPPSVETATLDVERDAAEQGFERGAFDLVLAANVLHVARDLPRALANVRSLLRPGGCLLLIEATAPSRWADLVFGLTEGFWNFEPDGLRARHPLLSPEAWREALSAAGFEGLEAADAVPTPLARFARPRLVAARAPAASAAFLLLGDRGGVARRAADRLHALGRRAALVVHGAEAPSDGRDEHALDPADERALARLASDPALAGATLVDCRALDAPDGDGLDEAARAGLDFVRVLGAARSAAGRAPDAWVVTSAAQAVRADDAVSGPARALSAGLCSVLALEHPQAFGGTLDLGSGLAPERAAELLVSELLGSDGEEQVAFRDGRRFVARLVQARPVPRADARFSARASYLVTGGLGALGRKVAAWLAARGAGRVVLMARSAPPPAVHAELCALERGGTRMVFARGDAGREEDVRAVLAEIAASGFPLRGVVHAAGRGSPGRLLEIGPAELEAELRGKARGAWNLHRLTERDELDFFVLFSSMVAVWGARELGAYCAANRFLDALALHRRALGRPALALAWGPWSGALSGASEQEVRALGIEPLEPEQALEALGDLLASGVARCTVARVDWTAFRALMEARRRRPLFDELGEGSERGVCVPARRVARQVEPARAPTERERHEALRARVRGEIARVLGTSEAELSDGDAGLFDLGMDSLMAVELKKRLEDLVGLPLPQTLVFDHPTPDALTSFLIGLAGSGRGAAPRPAAALEGAERR